MKVYFSLLTCTVSRNLTPNAKSFCDRQAFSTAAIMLGSGMASRNYKNRPKLIALSILLGVRDRNSWGTIGKTSFLGRLNLIDYAIV